jgi:hypothetical protein
VIRQFPVREGELHVQQVLDQARCFQRGLLRTQHDRWLPTGLAQGRPPLRKCCPEPWTVGAGARRHRSRVLDVQESQQAEAGCRRLRDCRGGPVGKPGARSYQVRQPHGATRDVARDSRLRGADCGRQSRVLQIQKQLVTRRGDSSEVPSQAVPRPPSGGRGRTVAHRVR